MSAHKTIDKIGCVVLAVTLVLTILFMNAENLGIQAVSAAMGYESRLFDTSKVHTINIIMDDWDAFIEDCQSEEYYNCTVVIDNDICKNVAIRGKGNTSLTQAASYGNGRYSFKIEFDHYDDTNTYYGLDKLCLNNIIQDNTYMKEYLTYQMMAEMGVVSPLCSYAHITVNGEEWGLYLAVESVEESFLQRNYGSGYGKLYKPDSQSAGGTEPPANRGNRNNSAGNDDVLLKYIDDEFDSYSNIFENAKTDITDSDKTRLIKSLKKLSEGEELENTVDIDAVIRYFVVHNFVLNFDSYTGSMIHNYYLYEKEGQMQMIPWDYNLAFGGFESMSDASGLVNYPIDSPVSGGNTADRPMLAWIFENEEYTERYHQYFAELISEYFDSGYFEEMFDRVTALLSPYVEKDATKFCTYEQFETGAATLKTFCLLRAESIKKQLDGTLGSTADTQQSGTLIDAGDIQISDMGSMNQAAGGSAEKHRDQGGGNFNAEDTQGFAEPPDIGADENFDMENKNAPMQKPEAGGRPVEAEQADSTGQTENAAVSWLWFVISACILAVGLVFALVYKRRT